MKEGGAAFSGCCQSGCKALTVQAKVVSPSRVIVPADSLHPLLPTCSLAFQLSSIWGPESLGRGSFLAEGQPGQGQDLGRVVWVGVSSILSPRLPRGCDTNRIHKPRAVCGSSQGTRPTLSKCVWRGNTALPHRLHLSSCPLPSLSLPEMMTRVQGCPSQPGLGRGATAVLLSARAVLRFKLPANGDGWQGLPGSD